MKGTQNRVLSVGLLNSFQIPLEVSVQRAEGVFPRYWLHSVYCGPPALKDQRREEPFLVSRLDTGYPIPPPSASLGKTTHVPRLATPG